MFHKSVFHVSVTGLSLLLMLLIASSSCAIELEGLIEPSETIDVSSQIPGVIDEILVERGDFVKKGQLLTKLKAGVEATAVILASAKVEFGKRKAVRNEELFLKKLISSHEKDEIATELKIAELELRSAEDRLALRLIYSMVDGIVVQRFLGPGEYVGENPVFSIASVDPLFVEVVSPVTHVGKIRKGMIATVIPEEPVGGSYAARVIVVDPLIDAASGTFGVRLEVENKKGKLPAGLKCRVQFNP